MSFEYDDTRVAALVFCAIALIISVPFHILLIIVLVRYRKKNEFSFPFFQMVLSLSVNDLAAAIFVSLCFLSPLLPPKFFVDYMVPLVNIATEGSFGGGLAGDAIILVGIGLNRLVSYVFPHKTIWRPIHTAIFIILQWIYSVSFGLCSIHPQIHGTIHLNETTGVLVETIPESTLYAIKSFFGLLLQLLAGITITIVYSVCIGKLVYYKMTTNVGLASSLAVEARLSFQGFFLSASLLIGSFLYGYAAFHYFSVSAFFFGLLMLVGVSNFVLGPFIVIGMSKLIRKHIRMLFNLNSNVVHVLPTTGNSKPNGKHEESKL